MLSTPLSFMRTKRSTSGDPGGDLYISPGDPAFWVHHGHDGQDVDFVVSFNNSLEALYA